MPLETVDIAGIDILAAGGPYIGTGSKPGGDYYTVDDLNRFAASARELAGEVHIPIKLGHSKEQNLLRHSGLLDEHGAPAAGWLDAATIRVEGTKLLGDAKRVPAKLGQLMRAGAFRTRSVEQRVYTSQRTGKAHGWIIDGLALLGGKAPAVRTLDDIVALYDADGDLPELDGEPPEDVRTINYSAASISEDRMATDTLTLTPEQTAAIAKGLGLEPKDLAPEKLLAAIETATKTAAEAAVAKIKPELEKKLSDADAKIKALEKGDGKGAGDEVVEALKEQLKQLSADAEAGKGAAEALRVMQRDTLLDNAIRGGKLEPAMRAQYVKLYDASPDVTRETVEKLPKRDDLFKVYGADGADITGTGTGDGPTEDEQKADEMYRAYCQSVGIEAPETKATVAA